MALVVAMKQVTNLVNNNGVRAASEGVHLNEVNVLRTLGNPCRRLKDTVRIRPLRDGVILTRESVTVGFRRYLLIDHSHAKVGKDVRNLLMNKRVGLVRVSCQNDDRLLLAHGVVVDKDVTVVNVLLASDLRFNGSRHRFTSSLLINTKRGKILLTRLVGQLFVAEVEGRRIQRNVGIDVVEHLAISRHYWAVEAVVRMLELVAFKQDERIEDAIHSLLRQVDDMAMSKFGRIANVVRHDTSRSFLVERSRALVRQNHFDVALGEERLPKREVLKNSEGTWNAYLHSRMFRIVLNLEQSFTLVFKDVLTTRQAFRIVGENLFTLVAAITTLAVREFEHSDGTLVGTTVAMCRAHFIVRRLLQVVEPDEGRNAILLVLTVRIESGTVSTHEFRTIGRRNLLTTKQFKRTENSAVLERSALYDNIASDRLQVLKFQHLVKAVLDNGISQSSGEILSGSTLFKRLTHLAVHEHRATASEVARSGAVTRHVSKLLGCVAQRLGKRLKERTATGRASLVDFNVRDRSVLSKDGFHVLSTDVKDERHVFVNRLRRYVVGNGLYDAVVRVEGGMKQVLTVSRNRTAQDREGTTLAEGLFLKRLETINRRLQRIALVAAIEGEEQVHFVIRDDDLGRGGTAVNANEHLERFTFDQLSFRHLHDVAFSIPRGERKMLVKERRKRTFGLNVHTLIVAQSLFKLTDGVEFILMFCHQSCAHGSEELSVSRSGKVRLIQLEQAYEGGTERLDVGERSATENDLRQDITTTRQGIDGLQCHGMENAGGNVFLVNLTRQEVLDISLGKHTAARRYGIDVMALLRQSVHVVHADIEQASHLVNESTRTSGTVAIHANVRRLALLDKHQLGILTAYVNESTRFRIERLERTRHGNHFLHKLHGKAVSDAHGTGTSKADVEFFSFEVVRNVRQGFLYGLHETREVATITLEQHLSVFINGYQLHRGRAYVNS